MSRILKKQDEQHRRDLELQAKQHTELADLDSRRLLTDRFGKAAAQIGSDEPAVRLAGVYAMGLGVPQVTCSSPSSICLGGSLM